MLNLPIKILQTQQIEAAQATVEFTGINTLVAQWDALAKVTSRHLVLIVNAASEDAVAQRDVELILNADGGANYNYQYLEGEGVVPSAARADGQTEIIPLPIPGTTYANAFGGGIILMPHAFNTVNHKAILAMGGAAEDEVETSVGRWASAAAVTSLALSLSAGNFAANSAFQLGVVDERYLVEEIDLAGGAGVPSFDNIPQGEGDLAVIAYARSDQAAVEDEVLHTINDDAIAANYPARELLARAAVATTAYPVNQECAMVSGDNATALAFGIFAGTYFQYIKGNRPLFIIESGYHESTGPTAENRVMAGVRYNTEPINKLRFEPNAGTNFIAGSLFSLYRVPKRIIERVELTEDTPLVTFDNIPPNFESLLLHVYARTDRADILDFVDVEFNDDNVAAHYDYQNVRGRAAAADATQSLAAQFWFLVSGSTASAGSFGGGSLLLPGYAKTDRHKHGICLSADIVDRVRIDSDRWEDTTAITKIDLSPNAGTNFLAGSVFELEGILRREGLPPSEGMSVD